MNPLTLVKRIQKINSTEASLGISDDASWHAKYKDSAYVFVGGIPFDLTEGDLVAVFAQYGEVVDVNLVRDKGTGKSKGFAFLAYEDQRSTILAVDNLNGAKILGRIVRVDHVTKYKKKEEEEEDEEKEKEKREARGVCRAFQRGECTRGASCKFSHDEQRSANTGWGAEDVNSRWVNDLNENSQKDYRRPKDHGSEYSRDRKEAEAREMKSRSSDRDGQSSRTHHKERERERERSPRDQYRRDRDKISENYRKDIRYKEERGKQPSMKDVDKPRAERRPEDLHRERGEKRSRHENSSYR